jgi:hypothetical protein
MALMRKPAPAEIQAERDQATRDYENDLQAVRDRTAKLRAERLARPPEPPAPPKKKAAKPKA